MAHKLKEIEESEPRHGKSKQPEGSYSWPTITAGVVAAGGAGLVAASLIGVGPAALAGAAGYLAYRGMKRRPPRRETHAK
jgi:hypothetical protein